MPEGNIGILYFEFLCYVAYVQYQSRLNDFITEKWKR